MKSRKIRTRFVLFGRASVCWQATVTAGCMRVWKVSFVTVG